MTTTHFKITRQYPGRPELGGYSRSEFKTLLKKFGFKVKRPQNYVFFHHSRIYRFRWWGPDGFVVDIGKPYQYFGNWANSTEQTLPFKEWVQSEQQRALANKWLGNIK